MGQMVGEWLNFVGGAFFFVIRKKIFFFFGGYNRVAGGPLRISVVIG
jgi:hypothetical protein